LLLPHPLVSILELINFYSMFEANREVENKKLKKTLMAFAAVLKSTAAGIFDKILSRSLLT
jgi:hypothetical protein